MDIINNAQVASMAPPTTVTAAKKKILIVEDDFYIRDLYSLQAEQEGFEVIEAPDGADALQKARTDTFDVILVDLMIPNIDGITLIKTLKADPKFANIPCIVITNLEDSTKEQEAKTAGAAAYLLKIKNSPESVMNTVKTFLH